MALVSPTHKSTLGLEWWVLFFIVSRGGCKFPVTVVGVRWHSFLCGNPLGRYLLRLKRQVAKRVELLLKVMVSYGRATKMNILLIDDETEICFLVKNLLRREGIGCDVANTMAEGRRQLGIGQYHAVFLDIHLPDGLGYEMIAEIRARQPDVQVIRDKCRITNGLRRE